MLLENVLMNLRLRSCFLKDVKEYLKKGIVCVVVFIFEMFWFFEGILSWLLRRVV